MEHEEDDAWLARQVEGMDRSEIENLARGLAWTAWWLQESVECSWVFSTELISADPLSPGEEKWPDPPGNRYHQN